MNQGETIKSPTMVVGLSELKFWNNFVPKVSRRGEDVIDTHPTSKQIGSERSLDTETGLCFRGLCFRRPGFRLAKGRSRGGEND